jgi:hypothetical protein
MNIYLFQNDMVAVYEDGEQVEKLQGPLSEDLLAALRYVDGQWIVASAVTGDQYIFEKRLWFDEARRRLLRTRKMRARR